MGCGADGIMVHIYALISMIPNSKFKNNAICTQVLNNQHSVKNVGGFEIQWLRPCPDVNPLQLDPAEENGSSRIKVIDWSS